MYGFIHCCLEDMVLQLFGEPAWREILNLSGIKLRGASFLMHQVYDDEMTFKLVSAASTVSGLPVETCLEEFGKHFLVYCQKNGYDQILRVLGSNLYDFLTNLDNLHDHLASIYPGMRAPSFRVTRHINTNRINSIDQGSTCSMSSSMYLHYYSERAGLSPIVKGLVMAVAREFFETEIAVSEIERSWPAGTAREQAHDDHVVLKIDRRANDAKLSSDRTSHQVPAEQNKQPSAAELASQSGRMVSIYDSLSTSPHDSMVNSEIMMQTFPFHVIFDRRFKIVQVGNSLLRATSLFWRRRSTGPCSSGAQNQVRFSDLFNIIRPKIDFTFEAIADHTNQVFVVKTRPQVLNADHLRSQLSTSAPPIGQTGPARAPPTPRCPMDRIAEQRRAKFEPECKQPVVSKQSEQPPVQGHQEASAEQHLGLRLKGQMIILMSGELCLYLCSPRVDHLDQLLECGVNMSDFALHDRARELILMSHTHKEDRETVKKLDQASNDLKKMDTKLRLENKRTNEVLHNIFPAKIATLLSHGHQVESESFESVTCLYSDIIGFTKMCGSENVRPIDIVRLLNTLYLQFDNLTNIHGVFKVETIGDAYVVVGGLPEPVEDHADRCVRMGLDMVKVIGTVRSPADGNPIQMRIGIHSGPVMAGIVGIRVPRYSLFGNTTTLANQLETNGVGGKIHISDLTLRSLIERDRFVVEDNPNEISGVPFVTHFVTNYLGDKNETLKHERILEEQLIKDLELMGSELELVDDCKRKPIASAPYPHLADACLDSCPIPASLGEALAGDTQLAMEHPALLMDIEDQRQERSAQSLQGPFQLNKQKAHRDKRAMEEDRKQQQQQGEEKLGQQYLQQMSSQMSANIIDEAISQTIASAEAHSRAPKPASCQPSALGAQNLLALLSAGPTQLSLVLSPQVAVGKVSSAPDESAGQARADECSACPICLGSGQLPDGQLIYLHLAHADGRAGNSQPAQSGSSQALCGSPTGCLDPTPDSYFRPQERAETSEARRETETDKRNSPVASEGGPIEAGEMKSDSGSKLLGAAEASVEQTASSFERLVAELRDERRYLEAQIERLARIAAASTAKPAEQAGSVSQSASILNAGLNRMKRMDTLKLRRLKRIQEQQRGAQTIPSAPRRASLARPIDEAPNEDEAATAAAEEEETETDVGEAKRAPPVDGHAQNWFKGRDLQAGSKEIRATTLPSEPGSKRQPPSQSGYQALRASIANLLGDNHGTPSKRKSRFSLGHFQLPFGANGSRQRHSSPSGLESKQADPAASADDQLGVEGSLSGPGEAGHKRQASSGRISARATSCLCLRSSPSSQSVVDNAAQVR